MTCRSTLFRLTFSGLTGRILIAACIFLSTSVRGQDCSYLNSIATRCLDRKLSTLEMEEWGDCSDTLSVKKAFTDFAVQQERFISKIAMVLRLELLQSTTMEEIRTYLQDFDLITFSQPDHAEWAQDESDRLYVVYQLTKRYFRNEIDFDDFYTAYLNNYVYDQQNMGVNNFINSSFLYMLGRPPTQMEYESSLKLLGDQPAALFYMWGNSKQDYLQILTSNDNFIEHQLDYWYYYFRFEYPDLEERYRILSDLYQENDEVGVLEIIKYLLIHKV